MSAMRSEPPSIDSVRSNRAALGDGIRRTPVVEFPAAALPAAIDSLWLKLEAFQVGGTFKPRGALSAIRHLDDDRRARGLVTFSAGNHAIAVAYGAQRYGCSALVFMPATTDEYRIARARELGAEVQLVGDTRIAFAAAMSAAERHGRSFIDPLGGALITLGTASVAIELHEQLPVDVDTFVVAIGGGTLASGLAPTIKALRPRSRVIGIEPAGAPTLTHSLERGAPGDPGWTPDTIADSLAPPFAHAHSFALVRDYVDRILLVEDAEIRRAMRLLFEQMKLVIEPAGATALAGIISHPAAFAGRKLCAMVCGSNIGLTRFGRLLQETKS